MDAIEAAKSIGDVVSSTSIPHITRAICRLLPYSRDPGAWLDGVGPSDSGEVGLLAGEEGRKPMVARAAGSEAFLGASFRHDSDICARQLQFRGSPGARYASIPFDPGIGGWKGVPFQSALQTVPGRQRPGGAALSSRYCPRAPLYGTAPRKWSASAKLGCFHEPLIVKMSYR